MRGQAPGDRRFWEGRTEGCSCFTLDVNNDTAPVLAARCPTEVASLGLVRIRHPRTS